jgi:hypothetical protein
LITNERNLLNALRGDIALHHRAEQLGVTDFLFAKLSHNEKNDFGSPLAVACCICGRTGGIL